MDEPARIGVGGPVEVALKGKDRQQGSVVIALILDGEAGDKALTIPTGSCSASERD